MKLIAFYLPQYYEFEENNRWWGKGFTEWTNVRKAKPLFKGHYQPHVPYHSDYYTLDNPAVFAEQIEWAKKYGIYGFCFYHYWMGYGKKLMEKPLELFRDHKELNMPFCLSWANHNWSRTWVGGDQEILMAQEYGDEMEWRQHYEYLREYFQDSRYICEDGKPILVIYLPASIPELRRMLSKLNEWAIEDGFNGICFISQEAGYAINNIDDDYGIEYCIQYEPNYTKAHNHTRDLMDSLISNPGYIVNRVSENIKHKLAKHMKKKNWYLTKHNYDAHWKKVLSYKNIHPKMIPCAFTAFDNTPRRGENGQVYHESTPEKFQKYLTLLLKKNKTDYHKDLVFINAWNEWGEGAVLEPDERYGFGYLEAVRNSLIKVGEWNK